MACLLDLIATCDRICTSSFSEGHGHNLAGVRACDLVPT